MTEATTATTQAKTAKNSGSPFGQPNYEIPKIDLPKMEVPAAFRELADKGVAQARDTYEKAKAVTEKATDQLKDTYTTAAKGATDYNLKVIEIARTNTNTAVDNAYELLGVKSLLGIRRTVDQTCAQAVRGDDRANQGAYGARPEGGDRNHR